MISVSVDLKDRAYDIDIEPNSLWRIGVAVASLGSVSNVVLITDDIVDPLYGKQVLKALTDRGLDVDEIIIPNGEDSKSIDLAYELWSRFLEIGIDRHSVVVALGGGVVGDLAGFVAATYARGIRFFQVPTSLLAQVDSSIGGKTAIDLKNKKNIIGAFHQPVGVLIDPTVLQTLPDSQYRAGLGEVVKYGLALDSSFFELLERNTNAILNRDPIILCEVLAICCRLKAQIVVEDERDELNIRATLNYGHTFGHAFESLLGFDKLLHGDGVAIGSIYAAKLAHYLARKGDARFLSIDDKWIERQTNLFQRLNLFTSLPKIADDEKRLSMQFSTMICEIMKTDKKTTSNKLNFILPTNLGKCCLVQDVDLKDVEYVLNS